MIAALVAPLAFLVDLLLGDPPRKTHPVLIIGKTIVMLKNLLKRLGTGKKKEILQGILLVFLVVGGSCLLAAAVVKLAGFFSYFFSVCVSIWLISTTIAAKGLAKAAGEIDLLLSKGDLKGARETVALIVGRDTEDMSEEEIVRAAVETVAENTVDAVVSPLFYAFIGGAPLAMAYRAVNTLDSMVGYKNDELRFLGWASARLDDAANYLPARITGILMVVAALLTGENHVRAWKSVFRDAHKHPSPNSGIPEAAVAGALGVRLGGRNVYRGKVSFRAFMGEPVHKLSGRHIQRAVRLMYLTGFLAVISGTVVSLVWIKIF